MLSTLVHNQPVNKGSQWVVYIATETIARNRKGPTESANEKYQHNVEEACGVMQESFTMFTKEGIQVEMIGITLKQKAIGI